LRKLRRKDGGWGEVLPILWNVGGGAIPAVKPEKEKAGNIVKCPSCGAVVSAMTAKCPDCGHEFRNANVGGEIKQFFEKVVSLESGKYTSTKQSKLDAYVLGYPIPNTKEDIFEFIMFCSARAKWDSENEYNRWGTKCVQAYQRAEITMGSDRETLAQLAGILRKNNVLVVEEEAETRKAKFKAKEKRRKVSRWVKIFAGAGITIILFWEFYALFLNSDNSPTHFIINVVENIGVEVPESAEIAAGNIHLAGSIRSFLLPAGGLVMRPGDDKKSLDFVVEFSAQKNFQSALNAASDKIIKEKGWKKENCTIALSNTDPAVMTIGGISLGINRLSPELKFADIKVEKDKFEDIISLLTTIKPGEPQIVRFSIPMTKKKQRALMTMENIEFFFSPNYQIDRNTLFGDPVKVSVE
jgi:hypothetical protein